MTNGRDLPWVQDTTAANVRSAWGASYRDVVILDPWNRPIDPPYNLTTFDLANPVNKEALKARLRAAALFVDSDNDGLGDDWEERFLTTLEAGPTSDTDRDGSMELLEYAKGSDPGDFASLPSLNTGTALVEGKIRQILGFRRRLGAAGGLQYVIQWSKSGQNWEDAGNRLTLLDAVNPYDGSGTELVTYAISDSSDPDDLFRVVVSVPVAQGE